MSLSLQLAKSVKSNKFLKPNALPFALSSIRHQSEKNPASVCADLLLPVCGKAALAKTECGKKKAKGEKKKEDAIFASLWAHPECCGDPCPDVFPRFDDLYYKPSDKFTRVYTQTWVECPKKRIVKKPVCDYGNFIYPEYERRPRKRQSKGAATCKISSDLGLMKCYRPPIPGPCPKFMMPGCKVAREPPKCKQNKWPSGCKKICCPYPSFSECLKPRPKPRHPIECKCLDPISMCDVWAEVKRRAALEATRIVRR